MTMDYSSGAGQLAAGRRLGAYEIREELGRGGMGVVYRAHEASLDREVAIKVLSPEVSSDSSTAHRLLREARVMARIEHPNILGVYAAGEEDGRLFIAMQLVTGETLASRLAREGRLPILESLRIAREVASALDAACDAGVVHRDVKPDNILLDARGRVKVADFGLSRDLSSGIHLTQSNAYVGTPRYSSPEQWRNLDLDSRSDVYSLGIVLYEMLAGRAPYDAPSLVTLMQQVLEGEAPPLEEALPEVPSRVSTLISRMIALEPCDRFPTPGIVVMEIDSILADLPGQGEEAAAAGKDRPAPTVEEERAGGRGVRLSAGSKPTGGSSDGSKLGSRPSEGSKLGSRPSEGSKLGSRPSEGSKLGSGPSGGSKLGSRPAEGSKLGSRSSQASRPSRSASSPKDSDEAEDFGDEGPDPTGPLKVALVVVLVLLAGTLLWSWRTRAARPGAPVAVASPGTGPAVGSDAVGARPTPTSLSVSTTPKNPGAQLKVYVCDFQPYARDDRLDWLRVAGPDLLMTGLDQQPWVGILSREVVEAKLQGGATPDNRRFPRLVRVVKGLGGDVVVEGRYLRGGNAVVLNLKLHVLHLRQVRALRVVASTDDPDAMLRILDQAAAQVTRTLSQVYPARHPRQPFPAVASAGSLVGVLGDPRPPLAEGSQAANAPGKPDRVAKLGARPEGPQDKVSNDPTAGVSAPDADQGAQTRQAQPSLSLPSSPADKKLEALQAYNRGLQILGNVRGKERYRLALEQFDRALAACPHFAPALKAREAARAAAGNNP